MKTSLPRLLRLLASTSLALLLSTQAIAADGHPKIGLVLGGGGARGAAHIGVLEVLEELKVPVDCVAGTSMGALVAGAYASGLTPAMMRKALAEADWDTMFSDIPDFSDVNYRFKETLRRFIPGSELGVSSDGVRFPPGVVDGIKIKLFFNQLVGANRTERVIEKLPLPVSLIATDIGTGERVVMRDGSLTTAMRASMSVPGLLAPITRDGRKLVDGGLVDNVPIAEARERCDADIVIAINVGSPLMPAERVGSLLTISAQMVNILTEQNVTRSLATLKPTDIYIQPDLGTISAGDFSRNAEAADRGRAAAEAVRDRLARLGTDAATYAQWREPIDRSYKPKPVIDEIEIAGLERVNPAMVERQLTIKPGEQLATSSIDRDVLRMYGDGFYQSVDYQLLNQRDRNILRILPVEKSWGPDYLRFALNLDTDSNQGSSFGLRAAYQKTLINDLGAELLVTVGIGSNLGAGIDFYQPLDPAQRFFVETGVKYERIQQDIFQDNSRVAQYTNSGTAFALSVGTNFGTLGQARLGWIEQKRNFDRDIGASQLPNFETSYSGWNARLSLDQMNRLYFATQGWSTKLDYFDSNDAGFARAEVDVQGAFSLGKTVITGRANYVGSPRGQLPFYSAGRLGGFLNMSAFARGQILGDEITYAGIRAEQIIGTFPIGLRGDMRLGFALEGAHVGTYYTETNLSGTNILNSAAIYLGGETPFGPAYLGVGYSTSGASNLFLNIGIP
ncbi:patatin-like phospholipase family protein [Dechloromonas sp. H13]|uniref:patatin-like phospholipase family protein n=1 Tax=Dechloromonas sp. H13 TaxID=2570193 RepID=UPI0012916110|nr:patatin-like phospholipase family protein [Dechloromonas sp. H13]